MQKGLKVQSSSVRGTPYAAYLVFAYFQHFAYCVFLTRITVIYLILNHYVLRIAYDCSFHIQPTLTRFAYCVLRVAYCVLARKRLPQYAIAQNAAYGVPLISHRV
jgi:hypothetical protein